MKDGEFPIKIADDELVLRATPHVLRTILSKYGGIRQVLQKIYMIEEEAIYDVIVAALSGPDPNGVQRAKNWKSVVRDNIFEHGILDLVDPLTTFVTFLANGGRHKVEEVEEDDTGKH